MSLSKALLAGVLESEARKRASAVPAGGRLEPGTQVTLSHGERVPKPAPAGPAGTRLEPFRRVRLADTGDYTNAVVA